MARKKIDSLENMSFEELIKELEQAADKLESSELSLEESIAMFAKSMNVSKLAADKIQLAEKTVEQLIEDNNGKIEYKEFTGEDN